MTISEDKKIITLPVPLGTTVYTFNTRCNDACTFQKDKINQMESIDKMQISCSQDAICHIKLIGTLCESLTLRNLYYILPDWGTKWFATEDEAFAAGTKLVEEHKNRMAKLGLELDY